MSSCADIKAMIRQWAVTTACIFFIFQTPSLPAKEFLTEKEIERIQTNHETDVRVKLYLEFALNRLKVAEERLSGKESEPGDPFEFFGPEDLLEGFYRILESVMINLEDAYASPDPAEESRVQKALRTLKASAENAFGRLDALEEMAREKGKEELWDLVIKAKEINQGAHEGAVRGLARKPKFPPQKSPGR